MDAATYMCQQPNAILKTISLYISGVVFECAHIYVSWCVAVCGKKRVITQLAVKGEVVHKLRAKIRVLGNSTHCASVVILGISPALILS